MPEDQKSSFSEAVETGASAAHTICGAIKTGKAISSAAKGAAAGGPYGAVAGAVWAGRKHIGKIIVAVIALLMLPVLFVLMLPGLIFGGLTNAFSPSDPEIPILNSETAIIENANEITFTLNGILGEALDDVLARIEADFACNGQYRPSMFRTPLFLPQSPDQSRCSHESLACWCRNIDAACFPAGWRQGHSEKCFQNPCLWPHNTER